MPMPMPMRHPNAPVHFLVRIAPCYFFLLYFKLDTKWLLTNLIAQFYRPNSFAFNCDFATSNGFFSLFGRSNSSPEQLGHIAPIFVVHDSQNVHSKEQIYATSFSPVNLPHCSQDDFIFNITYTYQWIKIHYRLGTYSRPYQLIRFLFILLKDSAVIPRYEAIQCIGVSSTIFFSINSQK